MQKINFRITEWDKKKFDRYCRQNDMTISQAIRKYIFKCIGKPIKEAVRP